MHVFCYVCSVAVRGSFLSKAVYTFSLNGNVSGLRRLWATPITWNSTCSLIALNPRFKCLISAKILCNTTALAHVSPRLLRSKLQSRKFGFEAHDEHLFIITHQVSAGSVPSVHARVWPTLSAKSLWLTPPSCPPNKRTQTSPNAHKTYELWFKQIIWEIDRYKSRSFDFATTEYRHTQYPDSATHANKDVECSYKLPCPVLKLSIFFEGSCHPRRALQHYQQSPA